MTYKLKNAIYFLLLILLIIGAVYVMVYYLISTDPERLSNFPSLFLSIVVAYIFIQLIKRFFQGDMVWYNYLFYIGLVGIVAPLFSSFLNENVLFMLARVGSVFLLLSPAIELVVFYKNKNREKNKNSASSDF